jgi:hypothetical protein
MNVMGGGSNLTTLSGGGIVNQNAYNNAVMAQRTAAQEQAVCSRFEECSKYIDKAQLATGKVIAMDGGKEMSKCTEAITSCFDQSGVNAKNCESMVDRCVSPKCKAGCTDQALTSSIYDGCAAQLSPVMVLGCQQFPTVKGLVVAKYVSAGAAAAAAQKAQADAAAAQAQAAAANNDAQMQQMTQQMQQMQQQMQQQQAEAAAQTQKAIADLAAAQAAAASAAAVAPAPTNNSPAPTVQTVAKEEIMARSNVSGQILSSLDRIDSNLQQVKKVMQTVFDYAGCDYRGENCGEIRRITAFKDKVNKYFQPFEDTVDVMYDSIGDAQALGIDMTNVYMLLEGACSRWGYYQCPEKVDSTTKQCPVLGTDTNVIWGNPVSVMSNNSEALQSMMDGQNNMNLVLRCASQMGKLAGGSGMLARRAKAGNGTELDIEPLRYALSLETFKGSNTYVKPGCNADVTNNSVCVDGVDDSGICADTTKGGYKGVNPKFILDKIHMNNSSSKGSCSESKDTDCSNAITETMCSETPDKELISRRASNITKEMQKQYGYLEGLAKQIRTMIQKQAMDTDKQANEEAASNSATTKDYSSLCSDQIIAGVAETANCLISEVQSLISTIRGASGAYTQRKNCENLIGRLYIAGITGASTNCAKKDTAISELEKQTGELVKKRDENKKTSLGSGVTIVASNG